VASERSISAVLQDILRNVQEIIRAEVKLAKAEVGAEARKALASAVWVIVGSVCAALAVTFALWTIAYAVGLIWPMWAATLSVAVVLGLAASVLLASGIRRLKLVKPTPERTVETIKENVAWVRQSPK
jgi:Putative Actinobacterial Holin-X, holin superfamily III